ncbi:MAG: diguanylate cyclase [Myxococcaceae bacterium]|nr:diguanylate cyclase [Myxococcaceae bacterium]
MADSTPITHSIPAAGPRGRNDESVEWALRELELAIEGSPQESKARDALELLRKSFTSVQASASTDPLTGLANRSWFCQVLEDRLRPGMTASARAAVLFLDLDGFKDVNDQRGHTAGDRLLAEVATRISRSVRDQDLVARHGGDEFVVLLENIENPAVAHAVAARVVDAISMPFTLDDAAITLGVSIGVAYFPEHGHSGTELLQHADHAMYRAKNQGGRSYAVFGEREELVLPRTPLRSWAWELAPLARQLAADVPRVLFKRIK